MQFCKECNKAKWKVIYFAITVKYRIQLTYWQRVSKYQYDKYNAFQFSLNSSIYWSNNISPIIYSLWINNKKNEKYITTIYIPNIQNKSRISAIIDESALAHDGIIILVRHAGTITNVISKNLPSSDTKWLPIMTYIHPPEHWDDVACLHGEQG
jgi:hypothetical protein